MDLRNRLLSTSQIIAAIEVLMPKLLTEVSENPSKEDNCVSEMRMLPAWFMLRVIVDNNGRMTKLIPPTEVKLGALSVCKAVKLSNSNVPLILCKPEAVKLVTVELRLTVISPSTFSTPCGIVTSVIATAVTIILP